MKKEKRIEINAAIFPEIMSVNIGDKKLQEDTDNVQGIGNVVASISLPRGAYLLYLQNFL